MPTGAFGSVKPARLCRIASETATMAGCCPTTLSCSRSSIFISSFCVFCCNIFSAGIPVQDAITFAMSSSVTLSRRKAPEAWAFFISSESSLSLVSSSGTSPNRIFEASSRFPSFSAFFAEFLVFSKTSEVFLTFLKITRSFSHCARIVEASTSSLAISSLIFAFRALSFRLSSNDARSMINRLILRSRSSMTEGTLSISIFSSAQASSIKSIALSGRNRF